MNENYPEKEIWKIDQTISYYGPLPVFFEADVVRGGLCCVEEFEAPN